MTLFCGGCHGCLTPCGKEERVDTAPQNLEELVKYIKELEDRIGWLENKVQELEYE